MCCSREAKLTQVGLLFRLTPRGGLIVVPVKAISDALEGGALMTTLPADPAGWLHNEKASSAQTQSRQSAFAVWSPDVEPSAPGLAEQYARTQQRAPWAARVGPRRYQPGKG